MGDEAEACAAGWWREITTACFEASALSVFRTSNAPAESSPEVGSSMTSKGGEWSSSSAMERRLRSPPDRPALRPEAPGSPTRVSAESASPSEARISESRDALAAATPRRLACSLSVSITESVANSWSLCGTNPTTVLVCSSYAAPLSMSSPASGFARPAIKLSSVDLPLPDAPINATSPRSGPGPEDA